MSPPTPIPEYAADCPLCTPTSDNILIAQFTITVLLGYISRRIIKKEHATGIESGKGAFTVMSLGMIWALILVYHASLKYLNDPGVDVWRSWGGMSFRQRTLGLICFGLNLFTLVGGGVAFGVSRLLWYVLVEKKEEERKRDEEGRGGVREVEREEESIELEEGTGKLLNH